jgi:hypothetical protein
MADGANCAAFAHAAVQVFAARGHHDLPTVVDDAYLFESRVPGNPFNAGENLIAPVEHHPVAQAAAQCIAGQQEPAPNLLQLRGSLPPEGQPG